ncbi:MAG: exodeoxyribonuclease III [Planctomycetota bacterium]|nr:MAG: exodeoxyribonuclease III [Planctomycetota bacterium]
MSVWTLATWNVNSLRARLDRVLSWLDRTRPDVLCLQETKCPDADFPREAFAAAGYRSAHAGQEDGLNGVAVLSREPLEGVVDLLPGNPSDTQRRFLSVRTSGVRVLCVYVPNGQAVGSEAYFYKLDWLSRLLAFLRERHRPDEELALLGDFNIAPDDRDVDDPARWEGGIHCTAHERRMLEHLQAWGLVDCQRALEPEARRFTWFDYRSTYRGFSAAKGLRIDLIYATRPLVERLSELRVDLEERAGERPSDHAPVLARFAR